MELCECYKYQRPWNLLYSSHPNFCVGDSFFYTSFSIRVLNAVKKALNMIFLIIVLYGDNIYIDESFVVSKIENIPIFIYQYVLKRIYDIVGILCIDKMVEDDKYDSNLTLRSYKVVYLCNSHLQFNQLYIHFHLIQKM